MKSIIKLILTESGTARSGNAIHTGFGAALHEKNVSVIVGRFYFKDLYIAFLHRHIHFVKQSDHFCGMKVEPVSTPLLPCHAVLNPV